MQYASHSSLQLVYLIWDDLKFVHCKHRGPLHYWSIISIILSKLCVIIKSSFQATSITAVSRYSPLSHNQKYSYTNSNSKTLIQQSCND